MKPHHACALLAAVWLCHAGLEGQLIREPTATSGTGDTSETGAGRLVYTPKRPESPSRPFKETNPFQPTQWIAPVFVLLLLVGSLLFLQKKGYFGINRHRSVGKLRIKDQIVLGNRQFLLVVEYGEKEILVGIGPGFIRHVSTLSPDGFDGKTKEELQGKFDETLQGKLESPADEN